MIKGLVYIYTLEYPEGNVRYVGKTQDLKTRFCKHLRDAKYSTNSRRLAWIRSLLNVGEIPCINVLDIVEEKEWAFWEKHYISLIKSWGFDLTNATFGGDGLLATEEVKAKISKSCKEHWKHNKTWTSGKAGMGLKLGPKPGHRFSKEVVEKRTAILNQYVKENGAWNKGLALKKPEPLHKGKGFTGLLNPTRRVIQLSSEGAFIKEWGSASEAAHKLGISGDIIRDCVKGKRKNALGCIWISKLKYEEICQKEI